jgi:hypothetical protein
MKTVMAIILTLFQFMIYYLGIYHLLVIVFDLILVDGPVHTIESVIYQSQFSYSVITLLLIIGIELIRDSKNN